MEPLNANIEIVLTSLCDKAEEHDLTTGVILSTQSFGCTVLFLLIVSLYRNRDKEIRQVTPNFLRRLSSTGSASEKTPDPSSAASGPSSESEKDCMSPDLPKKIRKRSKSMKEKREQHMEEMFETAHKRMIQPKPRHRPKETKVETPTSVASTPSDTAATTVDSGQTAPHDSQLLLPTATTTLTIVTSSTSRSGIKVRKSVEMVGVETVVKERHRRRISMLAELEPGNHRLEWSQYEEVDSPAHDAVLSKSCNGSFSVSSSAVGSATGGNQQGSVPKSPRHSMHHPTVSDLVEESGSSASSSSASSAASTPELVRREAQLGQGASTSASADDRGTAPEVSRPVIGDMSIPSGLSPAPYRRAPSLADGVAAAGSKQRKLDSRTPVCV